MANKNSRVQGQDQQSLAAGASVTVQNKDRDNTMTQFTVANLAAQECGALGAVLFVCGTDKIPALPVFPGQIVTLETDGPFTIINPLSVAGVSQNETIYYVVGQLFLANAAANRQQQSSAAVSSGGGGGSGSGLTGQAVNGRAAQLLGPGFLAGFGSKP